MSEIKKKSNIKNKNEENINFIFVNTTHNGIKCSSCGQEPIIGCRYKCSICNDYNLCEKCEEENSKSGEHFHNFIKIRKEEKND